MVSTQNKHVTTYNAFGIIRGRVEPGKTFNIILK